MIEQQVTISKEQLENLMILSFIISFVLWSVERVLLLISNYFTTEEKE